ncbi:MAG TPA: hypothetical protein VK629_10770 [Steroidobacteraceae bacterium]|nr:hypothetical protein [Steroidobacteraceae bacterium]
MKQAQAKKTKTAEKKQTNDLRSRGAPIAGTAVVWSKGCEDRYGISAVTRWRWESTGRLPKRDVNLGGKLGWRPETLAAAERGSSAA